MTKSNTGTYVPSLDGVRAISILMVVYSHLSVTHVLPHFMRASTIGSSAVIVFFVLSGFLITSQLQSELQKRQTIRLGRFYVRRLLRLVPGLMLVVAFACWLASRGLVPLAKVDVLRAITYTADYYKPHYWTIAHLWSLSAEEQFYLLWPLVLLLAGLRRARTCAIAAVLICPALRIAAWYGGMDEALVFRRFELVADALACGCLLALERESFRNSRIWKTVRPSYVVAAASALIMAWSVAHRFWPASEVIGRSFISLAAVLIIGAVTYFPDSKPARFLSLKPLIWIGQISYSLYLWQQMFLVATPGVSETPLRFPFNLMAAFALAVFSYYCFESPIRNFGKWITNGPVGVTAPVTERIDPFVEPAADPYQSVRIKA